VRAAAGWWPIWWWSIIRPKRRPQQPTLWLAEIDRSQSLIRLGPTTLAHRDADHRATLEAGDAGVFA
jgi:hypothetical protein